MPDPSSPTIADCLSGIDWDDLLDTIKEQKCVLFLGSGVYQMPGGESIETALNTWLDASNPEHPEIRLFNTDGFYLFRKNRLKRKVISKISEFYNQPFPENEANFTRLAQIPFSIVMTLTPDNLLARTFNQLGFEYQSDFYFRHRKATDHFERPTKIKPLIYNLLGNVEEPESLVLTHSDFFDYLDSVFKANSMNIELKDELERAERYIFLGLPYEKWYFQILLRILSLHADKLKEVERLAMREFEDPNLHQIYTEEFKIEFFPGNTDLFIRELHQRCAASNLLKVPLQSATHEAKSPELSLDDVRELVAKALIDEAMLGLKSIIGQRKPYANRLSNDLLSLRTRYHLLREREMRGTIYPQDLNVEYNQLVESLIEIINSVEQL